MSAPTFIAASTGATDAAGAWTATCHAPGAAGRIIIFQQLHDGTTADAAITSTTNIVSLDGISGAWNVIQGQPGGLQLIPVGSPTAAYQRLYICRSASTSAPVITGTNAGGDDIYWRFYEFDNVITSAGGGVSVATVIENVTAGATTFTAGTSATASLPDVTTLGPDRLGLIFGAANDDNAPGNITGNNYFSGAPGVYADAGGTDGAIYFARATMATADTATGGTFSITASDAWGVVGFALIGTTVTPPAETLVLEQGYVDFADPGVL